MRTPPHPHTTYPPPTDPLPLSYPLSGPNPNPNPDPNPNLTLPLSYPLSGPNPNLTLPLSYPLPCKIGKLRHRIYTACLEFNRQVRATSPRHHHPTLLKRSENPITVHLIHAPGSIHAVSHEFARFFSFFSPQKSGYGALSNSGATVFGTLIQN